MYLIYQTEALSFFNVTYEITDAFFPPRHEFKNFVMVDTELLHLQPLMMSHFHFLIIVEQAMPPTVDSKIRRTWEWMLVNGSKCNSPLSTSTTFLV